MNLSLNIRFDADQAALYPLLWCINKITARGQKCRMSTRTDLWGQKNPKVLKKAASYRNTVRKIVLIIFSSWTIYCRMQLGELVNSARLSQRTGK